jgi:response regulator NasT
MVGDEIQHLRVLIANERRDRLELLAQVVAGLGHEVIAPQIEVSEVGPVTAREHPDVAFVGLGESSQHALEFLGQVKLIRIRYCRLAYNFHVFRGSKSQHTVPIAHRFN